MAAIRTTVRPLYAVMYGIDGYSHCPLQGGPCRRRKRPQEKRIILQKRLNPSRFLEERRRGESEEVYDTEIEFELEFSVKKSQLVSAAAFILEQIIPLTRADDILADDNSQNSVIFFAESVLGEQVYSLFRSFISKDAIFSWRVV